MAPAISAYPRTGVHLGHRATHLIRNFAESASCRSLPIRVAAPQRAAAARNPRPVVQTACVASEPAAAADGRRLAPSSQTTNETHQAQSTIAVDVLTAGKFLSTAAISVILAYVTHPYLLGMFHEVLDVSSTVDGPFETSLFGLVGIIYGLMGGNTFLYLYERQVSIVQELYGETFALELLLQQTFLAIPGPEPRQELAAAVRRYLAEEIFEPSDMVSPFEPGSSFTQLADLVLEAKQAGHDVQGLVVAIQKLADAQSRRSAVAAQVLPGIHWVFLNSLLMIFAVCFLVFDAGTDIPEAGMATERRIGFAALIGVLVLTQQVLQDLNDPVHGLYTFRSNLEQRLTYLYSLLRQLESGPAGKVPAELQRLNELGLIGALIDSEEAPSTSPPLQKGRRSRLQPGSYVGGPLEKFDGTWTAAVAPGLQKSQDH